MEKEHESFLKSFLSGIFSGVFLLLPMGSFGGFYTTSFLQNFLSNKPKKKWIVLGLLAVVGLFIGTLPRLLMGVNYVNANFPLASYLFFGFATLGLITPIIFNEIKREKKNLLEKILFPVLIALGFLVSFLLYFFFGKERVNSLGDSSFVMVLVGFILGFAFFIPGLPLKPIISSMGLTNTLSKILTNIPDNIDRSKSFLSLFLMLLGFLLNIAIFYYPLRLAFKKIKNIFGGLVSGLLLGDVIGSFVSHGEFKFTDFPAKYSGEVQNIANWGFALFGLFIAVIMFFAFTNISRGEEDKNLVNSPLYDAYGKKKKKFLFFDKER